MMFNSTIKFEANRRDLEKLIKIAIEAGATDAKIITTDKIVLDERVRWKCMIPTCFGYGTSIHCPPYSPTTEQMKQIVSKYRYAILLRLEVSIENQVNPIDRMVELVDRLNEIVTKVEVEAQRLGYYLAMGFKGGPCSLCGLFSQKWFDDLRAGGEIQKCRILEGKPVCSQYFKARPSLEAVGVDVYKTAHNIGWKMIELKQNIPHAFWMGMVLII